MIVGARLDVHVGPRVQTVVTYQELGRCAGCGARIYWCLTAKAARMPVDPTPDAAGVYVSHFATCPQRALFARRARTRRQRGARGGGGERRAQTDADRGTAEPTEGDGRGTGGGA